MQSNRSAFVKRLPTFVCDYIPRIELEIHSEGVTSDLVTASGYDSQLSQHREHIQRSRES